MVYNSGDWYEGGWFSGVKHGAGKERVAGEEAEGAFLYGVRHGAGSVRDRAGLLY
jgi:hypothetical protein